MGPVWVMEEREEIRRGFVMIYRPTLTSVVLDNTICLVVAFADVFVVTPQHVSFFGRGLYFRLSRPGSFIQLAYQFLIGGKRRDLHLCSLTTSRRQLDISRREYMISHSRYSSSIDHTSGQIEARCLHPRRELHREAIASEVELFPDFEADLDGCFLYFDCSERSTTTFISESVIPS